MPITVPEEGDEITKAISDAWFTDIRDRLNALKPDDIADRALDTQVPELAITSSTVEIYSSGGSSLGVNHTYTAATAPYPGYDQTSGWLVVGNSAVLTQGGSSYGGAVQKLEMDGTFSVTRPSPTSDANFAGGILIFCNIRVVQLFDGGESYPTTQGLAPIFAAFTLQIKLQTSGWVNIAATEEIINNMGPDNISWALCLNNLVEPLAENVIGVRAMVSVHRGSVAAADAKVILGDCNLTVIALRSGFISS